MPGPISPDGIAGDSSRIPDKVFEIFNQLLRMKWNGTSAVITLKEFRDALLAAGFTLERIKAERLLDIEEAYRAQKWKVFYDQPGFNETHQPRYIFSKS